MVEIKDPKSKKYDRQIRIWGAHGQAALESAKICLLNCGPTGSETLKNLVLGGIAGFTIVDGSKVESRDLGNNFLLAETDLGHSKAQGVSSLLKELNDSVAGGFVETDPEQLIDDQPDFFQGFSLVIATQLREATLLKLDSICRAEGVKLIAVRSYGLIATLRVSAAEHTIIETKPDNAVGDLRFHAPWKELREFAMSFKLSELDEITHKHLPFAILLIQAVDHWKAGHQGKMPSGSKERNEFKALLKSWQRQIDGIPVEEENFSEAMTNASKVWSQHGIPSEVQAVLQDDCTNVSSSSSSFWCLAAALKRFIEQEGKGLLPLEGTLPDMHATTDLYLRLQRVYTAKAEADVDAVEQHLRAILKEAGISGSSIARADVKLFSKNARHLRLVRFRSFSEEYGSSCRHNVLRQALTAEDQATNATLYILMRAVDRFYESHKHFPGTFDSPPESEISVLKSTASALLSEIVASPSPAWDDCLAEMCRFGAGELHCVAAIIAGMAAQEAIKLLTKQFVPQSGTLIYNAMGSTTSVFCL